MTDVDSNLTQYNVQTVPVRELPLESIRNAEEVFNQVVEADERKQLLETLIDKGLGVPSIENYHIKQSQVCRVSKNKIVRKSSSIKKDMKSKLTDATDHLRELLKKKKKVMKRIIEELGDNDWKVLNKSLNQKSEELRKDIKEKNQQKVQHLSNKFLPTLDKTPAILSRFQDASVYSHNEVSESPPIISEEPLVYGGIKLDEDEREAGDREENRV